MEACLLYTSALNGVSASTDQLTTLLDASTQIQNGIAQLDAGAAQLFRGDLGPVQHVGQLHEPRQRGGGVDVYKRQSQHRR